RVLPYVNRIAGVLLVLAGAYVAWYGWIETRDNKQDATVDRVTSWSYTVQDWMQQNRDFLIVGFVAVLAAVVAYVTYNRRADVRWHIPSIAVRPDESEHLAAFIDHVDVVVAVHGYGSEGLWTTLLLGGRNRALARHVGAALRAELAAHEFDVVDLLDAIPARLRGVHPDNPVNLPRGGGVQ